MLTINTRRYRPVNTSKVERYMGRDALERAAAHMKGWYGPPIPLSGVPGKVFLGPDGELCGRLRGGDEIGFHEGAILNVRRILRALDRTSAKLARQLRLNAGFASWDEVIETWSSLGKGQVLQISKVGPTGVVGASSSLWRVGTQPVAGAAASASPGGRQLTDATTGAIVFTNAGAGEYLNYLSAFVQATVGGNTLLLYDRLFDVAKTMNSTGTEAVTGVPTRYQSSTPSAQDYAGGNFCFPEVGGTALAATAHNWTVCLYRNQAGTDNQTMPSVAGVSGAIVDRLDLPLGTWFMPLAAGDTGVMDLAQMQCSATVATGVINFVIGHPIAYIWCPLANLNGPNDAARGPAGNMNRIFDDACLALLELPKPATTATTYGGSINVGAR